MRTLVTLLAAGLVLASCAPPSEDRTTKPPVVESAPGTVQSLGVYDCYGSDPIPPQIVLTSPVAGSALSGTVTLTVDATDNEAVTRVNFYLDGRLLVSDTTPPFELVWDSTTHGNGSAVFTAEARDGSCNGATSAPVQVLVENTGIATFDPTWGTPACAVVGNTCDSADLLQGRGGYEELHQPNTVGGSCADGSIAVWGDVESLQRLAVYRTDGTAFATGKEVTLQATVNAAASYGGEALDIYLAPDPSNPIWTYVDTVFAPSGVGSRTVSTQYLLPAGGRHVLRGVFRSNGRSTLPVPCASSDYFADHDDLVIAVGEEADTTPPGVSLTSPTEGATLERTITATVAASDNFGVNRVELYDGATLVASDARAPYVLSWASRTAPNGVHTLTARAYDLAGNVSISAPVQVVLDNDFVLPQASFITPQDGAILSQTVELQASATDDRGVVRVEYLSDGVLIGTAYAPPYRVSWNTRSWGLSNGPHVLSVTAYDAGGNASAASTVNVVADNDFVSPTAAITSPTSGASLTGTVSLTATANDDRGVASVSFYVDGYAVGVVTTPPYTFSWDSSGVFNGSHRLAAGARDIGGNFTYGKEISIQVSNPGIARFDSTLQVPRCDAVWASCDSRELVRARGQITYGSELNTPNTLDRCPDGMSGAYRRDESIERVRVSREDGSPMAAGKRVRIDVDVYVYSVAYNSLDLFYAADAQSVSWTYLTTVKPTGLRDQTLSADYVLPVGSQQAIRAVFRLDSSPGPCVPGPYTDRDDLVFPVGPQETDTVPPEQVVLTAPASGVTVTGTITLTAEASDTVGVAAVDFYDGETLIGTDAQTPYSLSWNSRSGPSGSRTLKARARDLAGNELFSQPVVVTADNDLVAPTVVLTAPVAGSRVGRVVTFTADASDDRGVTRVDFYSGERMVGSATSAPFTCVCDTKVVATGFSDLSAWAYDATGNVGKSAPVRVTISPETTPPSVSLTAPGNGALLSGTVTISATAYDTSGVSKVEFLRDGVLLGNDTSAPYSFSWNTKTVASGVHTLTARATDIHGNVATSPEVGVTLDNTAPSVTLTSPVSGANLAGGVILQANASDDVAIARVDFFVDGTLIASDTTAPYQGDWDSGNWNNRDHTLSASAYDTSGNVTMSTQVAVYTNQPGSAGTDFYGLRVPRCAMPSNLCDTTALLKGRYTGETSWPNTLYASCADGSGPSDAEKINRIKLSSVNGGPFTQGQRVRVEVYVNALDTTQDALDLFFASDATSPAWTHLTTVTPGAVGAQILVAEYVLPAGKLQAVRAQFRVGGNSGSTCSTGPLDDHDDLAFGVITGPVVALTTPTSSALVRGPVSMSATATDDQGVAKVEFYADSTLVGTDTTAPYSLIWDTTSMAEGLHVLTARAVDIDGLATVSTGVEVTVDNTLPEVTLTSPTQGTLVGGTVPVAATASDNQGIYKVEFYRGTTLIGTASTAPYVVSWNTASSGSGSFTLTAKAFDIVGNIRTSAGVWVNVDATAPTTTISAPAQNALVGQSVQFSANANDAQGVAKVEFYVDGVLIGTDTSAPYAITWDSTGVADGVHALRTKAYDTVGNIGSSNSISVIVDPLAPSAALTSPAQGLLLRGSVTLGATASDNRTVSRVEFYDGATLIGTDTTSPYGLSWDTTSVASGDHVLTVKAVDSAGNVGTSAEVEVTLDNTAPTTAISAPAQNAGLRGTVPVTATASDNLAVDKVEFYAGTTLLGTATTAPYVVSWDTTGVANGGVSLTTRAYDTAGNVTVSAVRTVSVDNAAPTVAITSPANGATLFLSTTIQANAGDNIGVTQVVFYDGATVIGTDTTSPYSVSWGLLGVAKGNHTLTAKAYDAAGNVTTSAPITVKVN